MAGKPERPVPRRRRRTSFERECYRRYPLGAWSFLVCHLPILIPAAVCVVLFNAVIRVLLWLVDAKLLGSQQIGVFASIVFAGFLLCYIAPILLGIWLVTPWINRRCRRALRRRGAPICIRCAYDMTGINSSTCPECGRPITA